jgi:predicted nucleic acid-binding protein
LGSSGDEVLIPPAVAQELESPPSHTVPITLAAVPKCRVEAPKDVVATKKLEAELQTGEAEAIVLAHELAAELLIDERAGRLVAKRLGINYLGVIGLLLRAKQVGMIPGVLPLIVRARDELNFFVADAVIEQVRQLAGE